ncbi:MAG: DUF2200 domain-containing protein [Fibrobacteres bacterium]|nr:DUF2200 domain-containing protein [Fibrobacterota bacterium]
MTIIDRETATREKFRKMVFGSVYPLYLQKVAKKGRSQEELDTVVSWLTGYRADGIRQCIESGMDFETFFANAPRIHPDAPKVKGSICGVRVEEIQDPLVRRVRILDKLVDELAKGKALEKVLRP